MENTHNIKDLIQKFYPYAKEKLGFDHPVRVVMRQDAENAKDSLGKTAYYDPAENLIVLYVTNRHPKDVLRSFSHELVHHAQNCRGDLDDLSTDGHYAKDGKGRETEAEAYLIGNGFLVRDWEDSMKYEGLNEMKLTKSDLLRIIQEELDNLKEKFEPEAVRPHASAIKQKRQPKKKGSTINNQRSLLDSLLASEEYKNSDLYKKLQLLRHFKGRFDAFTSLSRPHDDPVRSKEHDEAVTKELNKLKMAYKDITKRIKAGEPAPETARHEPLRRPYYDIEPGEDYVDYFVGNEYDSKAVARHHDKLMDRERQEADKARIQKLKKRGVFKETTKNEGVNKMKLTKKELLDIVKEEITKSVTEADKDGDGVPAPPKWADKDDNDPKVGDSLEEQVPKERPPLRKNWRELPVDHPERVAYRAWYNTHGPGSKKDKGSATADAKKQIDFMKGLGDNPIASLTASPDMQKQLSYLKALSDDPVGNLKLADLASISKEEADKLLSQVKALDVEVDAETQSAMKSAFDSPGAPEVGILSKDNVMALDNLLNNPDLEKDLDLDEEATEELEETNCGGKRDEEDIKESNQTWYKSSLYESLKSKWTK
jgi:hypothetical protein